MCDLVYPIYDAKVFRYEYDVTGPMPPNAR